MANPDWFCTYCLSYVPEDDIIVDADAEAMACPLCGCWDSLQSWQLRIVETGAEPIQ